MTRQHWPQRNSELIRVLVEANVEFAVVGGVAAIIHGSARMTVALDIAAPFDSDNLARLRDALAPYDAVHVTRTELRLADEPMERLQRFRLFLLQTTLGRLDVLREVQPLGVFDDLRFVDMEVYGQRVRVLQREDLMRVKRSVGRPKDVEVALELEAIAEHDGGSVR